ncbi:MAG: hypothetical protein Q7J29_11810 [Stagnimonas sp.]|nr:hypothetical protein [Stagnimonas sp.]
MRPVLAALLLSTSAQALDLRLPANGGTVPVQPLPTPADDEATVLEGVTVRGKFKPGDESLKRARDAVAKFGSQAISDTPMQDFLASQFAPPPSKSGEPNDRAATASQHGLATAGCTGCSIPENRR